MDFKNLDAVKNIPMSVMLAPSTGYVCDDVLPFIHDEYKDDEYFTDITNTLSQNGISFVDLRDTFKAAYKEAASSITEPTTTGQHAARTLPIRVTVIRSELFRLRKAFSALSTTRASTAPLIRQAAFGLPRPTKSRFGTIRQTPPVIFT